MKIRLLSFAIVLLCVPANISFADEVATEIQANTWKMDHVKFRYKGRGYSDKQKAKIETGDVMYTTSTTSPGLYLSCIGGKFRAGIVLEPRDMRQTFKTIKVSGVPVGGKLYLSHKDRMYLDMRLDDGPKISLGRWTYDKRELSAYSTGRKPAAKLYNAVVRGQTVQIMSEGRKTTTLDLPKPNKSYAEFGAGCGIGKLAKKK